MKPSKKFYLLVALAVLCLEPTRQHADAQGVVAPPASDETLIYFYRGKGGLGNVWIAVNDQTVARVGKEEFAVVRAKAGRITLNTAAAGVVLTSVAVDDRPGETVYLSWNIRDWQVTELDAEEGEALIRSSDRTEPIEEVLGNNEEIRALLDLQRLGFDLMQPSTEELSPDSEHAVLTIFRRQKQNKDGFRRPIEIAVWGEQGYLGTLAASQGIQVALTPGEHYFTSGYVGTTLMKATVEAGKRYYALADIGAMILRVRLEPIGASDSANLERWTREMQLLERNPDVNTARLEERESIVRNFINEQAEDARSGLLDFTEMNSEHAH